MELTPEQYEAQRAAMLAEYQLRIERDKRKLRRLRPYMQAAWPIVEPANAFVGGWHIDAIAEHLEACRKRQIRELLITIPPRHMKSLAAVVFFPTWVWTEEPWSRFLCASYADQLATRDSMKCRRIIQSRWYQERWGDRFTFVDDQNQKGRFENNKSGYRLATGVGGSATGEGGDYLIVDDAHKIEEVESEAMRRSVLDWWDGTMSTRGNDAKTVVKIVIGQRTHQDDLPGHLIEQGGWVHLDLPEEYIPTSSVTILGWADPRTKPNELLWPERIGPAEVKNFKKMGAYRYSALFQQRPSPAGGGIFKRDWWRFYEGDPFEMANTCDTVIQSWDMAFKDATANARVCGLVIGRKGSRAYLLDRVCGHWDFVATVRQVCSLTERWPQTLLKLIEDTANGPAVMSTLAHKVPGLVPVKVKGSKEARAAAVSPIAEAGGCYLPLHQPYVEEFIEELASFPTGHYKDNVDAWSQGVNRLFGGLAEFSLEELLEADSDQEADKKLVKEIEKENEDIEEELRKEGWLEGVGVEEE